jgi:[protein-PII] uridylyltransferase
VVSKESCAFVASRRIECLSHFRVANIVKPVKTSFMLGSHSFLIESLDEAPQAACELSKELSWSDRRDWFRSRLKQRPELKITEDELEIHFSAMPRHYWESVMEAELEWGLETVRGFLELVASPDVPATAPFISWRRIGTSGKVRVMLCTWDRHGLLAKAAAAFSAVRISIVHADVFTRADDVVLDTFTIAGADGHSAVTTSQMEQMGFLLEGALSEPPRFASVWACSRHKYLAPASRVVPEITFDNNTSPHYTVLHIETPDRLGLLYDILQAIADCGLNIKQARIETENDLARDTIHVTGASGQKVLQQNQLDSLRGRLESALIVTP